MPGVSMTRLWTVLVLVHTYHTGVPSEYVTRLDPGLRLSLERGAWQNGVATSLYDLQLLLVAPVVSVNGGRPLAAGTNNGPIQTLFGDARV